MISPSCHKESRSFCETYDPPIPRVGSLWARKQREVPRRTAYTLLRISFRKLQRRWCILQEINYWLISEGRVLWKIPCEITNANNCCCGNQDTKKHSCYFQYPVNNFRFSVNVALTLAIGPGSGRFFERLGNVQIFPQPWRRSRVWRIRIHDKYKINRTQRMDGDWPKLIGNWH